MKNFSTFKITLDQTILEALTCMDNANVKLLLVLDGVKFLGVLSIGDIQRAIIKQIPYDTKISQIMRDKFTVASVEQNSDEIKKIMLQQRVEFMPVLNSLGNIVEVVFWNDLFSDKSMNACTELQDVTVVIMAGGYGTRLKPLTNIIPKPLIPVGDKPIIHEIMDSFNRYGCRKYILSVNYKAESIKQYFVENKTNFGIDYVIEDLPLGTAGSLFLAKRFLDKTFFVSNCDILLDQNYADVLAFHRENKNLITVIVAMKHYHVPYGVIETGDNGTIVELIEKPDLLLKINTGVYILEPEVLEFIQNGEFIHITSLIERCMVAGKNVRIFPISEKSYKDMGEWSEYLKFIGVGSSCL